MSVESGLGWIPYFVEAMEYQFDEMMPNDRQHLQRRPKEYFQDHFYASFWFEDQGVRSMIDMFGPNNILIETDFPHPTCLFPHQAHIAAAVRNLSPNDRQRVLQDNAAELYNVVLPSASAVG